MSPIPLAALLRSEDLEEKETTRKLHGKKLVFRGITYVR